MLAESDNIYFPKTVDLMYFLFHKAVFIHLKYLSCVN